MYEKIDLLSDLLLFIIFSFPCGSRQYRDYVGFYFDTLL
jgi:hypothetical protein